MATATHLVTQLRQQFFELLFGENEGYICIASSLPLKEQFKQQFFAWPKQKTALVQYIASLEGKHNVWFCVNLLREEQRHKGAALPLNLVWADLDECSPDRVQPKPQIVIESSPERYQALWRLDENIDPETAQEFSKRIAYKYRENGADPSGWDLTQLLRVPFTRNFKYALTYVDAPEVVLLSAIKTPTHIDAMWELPESETQAELQYDESLPTLDELPAAEQVIYKFQGQLRSTAFRDLFVAVPEPDADWSGLLWRLINLCLEAGMSSEETLSVTMQAACNKYTRDKRPIKYLWRDICKAELRQREFNIATGYGGVALQMPEIISRAEMDALPTTFVDEYVEWATDATDAIPVFHELAGFILLSSLLAQTIRLKTGYGEVVPNLWGLILGDSTLSRKTTAMRMAMDFISEIDQELVLASDGSAEGLLSGLANRPNRVSIYYRDEVAGLFDSMAKKDYLAGLAETLTLLYDVPKYHPRVLRKETIIIQKPVFIFFGGGIRDATYATLNESHVLSGFLPRFLVVTGDTDMTRIRRTGPANDTGTAQRELLLRHLSNLYSSYAVSSIVNIGGQETSLDRTVETKLTPDAWERYGNIEMLMAQTASDSPASSVALPTFERLSRSLLKMGMLVAASRQTPSDEGEIEVAESDILTAAKYVQKWGSSSIDLISNVGTTTTQRILGRILAGIQKHPGIQRSKIMQQYHLTRREMDEVEATLVDRQQIVVAQVGKGKRYTAI